jgi:dipeptidyl aminopeptidase/acylaminoacyl peptidase
LHRRLNGRIGLLGSSLGGYVALHLAAERRDAPAIVTWNAPANLDELAAAAPGSQPSLGDEFLRELAAGVYTEAPAGVVRHLVIQAEADDLVGVEHGTSLFAHAGEPCDLVLIPGADHRLTDPAHRQEALARSLQWLLKFLAA